jgi:hypothetical protein
MPLQKILFKPGVNRENTRYTTEGGWYEGDKIRFRQGTPEKIGGWVQYSANTFEGVCRSLWDWVTLGNINLLGVGTSLKYYVNRGGTYYDITPIRSTVTLTNPFSVAAAGTSVVNVLDVDHGCTNQSTVSFSGAGITGLGGAITAAKLTGTFQITLVDDDNYTITVDAVSNATDVSGSPGGGTVITQYQVNAGPSFQIPFTGWGAGAWGLGCRHLGQWHSRYQRSSVVERPEFRRGFDLRRARPGRVLLERKQGTDANPGHDLNCRSRCHHDARRL